MAKNSDNDIFLTDLLPLWRQRDLLEELQSRFEQDPASVDEHLADFFRRRWRKSAATPTKNAKGASWKRPTGRCR